MKIITITGLKLQFDTQGSIEYNEAMAKSVIEHLNLVLSEKSLIGDARLSLTSDSEVVNIEPVISSKKYG